MKTYHFILVLSVAFLATACTSTRYASSEYDDVYFSSKDQAETVAVAKDFDEDRNTRTSRYDRQTENYNQDYYQDDDFAFSRRIRRFNQPGINSWRYYDPYYTNDLYYVMGTQSWNSWYGNGWYDWSRPRFGAPNYGFGSGWSFTYSTGYNPWGAYNPWQSYNSYNPFVNAYYGYNPYNTWNPYSVNRGWGWNSFSRGSYAYCPPSYYGGAGNGSNLGTSNSRARTYTQARRTSTRSLNSGVTSGNRNNNNYKPGGRTSRVASPNGRTGRATVNNPRTGTPTATNGTTRNARNSQYLRPRTRAEQATTRTRTNTAPRTGTYTPRNNTRNTGVNNTPSRTRTNTSPNRTRTRTYTPQNRRTNTSPNRTRTYTPQNRSTSPSQNRTRTYTPSRRTTTSPSPSRNRSYTPQNRTRSTTPRPSGGNSSRRPSKRN